METHQCPKCGSVETRKNGTANGEPKRRCKGCGYQFTRSVLKSFAVADQHLAVVLYLHGLSLRAVAKLLETSATTVLRWVRALGREHGRRPPPEAGGAVIVELDEMWHYLKKKPANSGSGKRSAVRVDAFLIGNAAVVTRPR